MKLECVAELSVGERGKIVAIFYTSQECLFNAGRFCVSMRLATFGQIACSVGVGLEARYQYTHTCLFTSLFPDIQGTI